MSGKIDYNKTMMASDIMPQKKNIDYNKTMMASDIMPQNKNIDYNKTMMASDIMPQNKNIDYNKTMMASDVIPQNKKKKPTLIIIICIIVIVIAALSFILPIGKKNVVIIDQTENEIETTNSGNVVTGFDGSTGYWTRDAESYIENGTMVKNRWVGDFYIGSDGKKVKNKLIDDTYYVDVNGLKVKNDWYRFTRNISGNNVVIWYYLGEDGAKLRDTFTPDGYYVDNNGMYIPGEYDLPDTEQYIPKNNYKN